MKNLKIFIIVIILLLIVLTIYLILKNKKEEIIEQPQYNENFILVDYNNEEEIEDDYIIKKYEEFKKYFNSDKLQEKDFENNNYLVVKITYDSCSERNIIPTNYKINENNIDITISYEKYCGVCPPEVKYYLLKIDKNIDKLKSNIKYKVIKKENCDPNVSYKPIIYLYPKETTEIEVKLGKEELLTTTYPKYNNGWNVVANSNGILNIGDKTYYGLYWEGYNNLSNVFVDGFVVSREETVNFLEEKLKLLGLNDRESNEFIIYWLPKLEKNEYNLIRFETLEKINEEMPLIINPKPDKIIRVFMEYMPITKKYKIKEQTLVKNERVGFTVVEWGGTRISEKN